MSKEKQCECCHEWWYGSDVKENLCPNCYYYFKRLKQQLAEKEQEFFVFQEDSSRNEQIYIRELAEKDKEIEKLKQQYTILENENGKLTTELIMDKYKKAQKEVSFGKQLAIQELEKVKKIVKDANGIVGHDWRIDRFKVLEAIDNQIKELKGE